MTERQITVSTLLEMKAAGENIACLTCYDAGFTRLLEAAGVEVLLVGDSLGNVLQGHDSTIPVSRQPTVPKDGSGCSPGRISGKT